MHSEAKMYDHNTRQILLPEDFLLPFEGELDKNNRWVKLVFMIPWWSIEDKYIKLFKSLKFGQKANSVRCALGALIIQNRLSLTDEETVQQITENPYLQYFIGFPKFQIEKPFDSSLMTRFRKRLTVNVINEINELIALEAIKTINAMKDSKEKSKKRKKDKNDDNDKTPPTGGSTRLFPESEGVQLNFLDNAGKLILDATCAPADIHYPTDLWLLNQSREKLEEIIDVLQIQFRGTYKKPRTYCIVARKQYLSIDKQRKPGMKKIRIAIKQQLRYIKRDLASIKKMVKRGSMDLNKRQLRNFYIVSEIYRQQSILINDKNHKIEDRIVSIAQPHIRPIVRGKASASVEFGAKLSISVVNGFALMEKVSFDNFNEGITLIESVERYKVRFGHYPEAVLADQIYRNRENRRYCDERGIRLSGPKLGRPKTNEVRENKKLEYQDAGERNAVEGKFGEAKRVYKMDRIFAKLKDTGETVIAMQLLVLNLERMLRLLLHFFSRAKFKVIFGATIGRAHV